MGDLIFLDSETTGLDYERSEIWEIAVAVNDGPVETHILVHSLKTASPEALRINGYFDRHPEGARSKGPMVDLELRELIYGNTLVCANPSFDRMMMWMRWKVEPYHYRSIDVETMAYTVLQYDEMKGMKDIRDDLWGMGYNIDQPDHTAYRDVVVLRDCYKALRAIQAAK